MENTMSTSRTLSPNMITLSVKDSRGWISSEDERYGSQVKAIKEDFLSGKLGNLAEYLAGNGYVDANMRLWAETKEQASHVKKLFEGIVSITGFNGNIAITASKNGNGFNVKYWMNEMETESLESVFARLLSKG